MTTQERQTSQRPQRTPRDMLSHLVLPVVVAVLGAVLVTALTPFGQNLREVLFPTHAVVIANVNLSGHPAKNATVSLDDAPAGTTSADGSLTLADVRAGTHVLHVEAFGAVPADKSFVVDRQAAVIDLGGIELQTVARLGFYVSLTPQTSNPKLDYEIALWIEGDEQTLADINKVTYSLPDPLPAKPVKGKKGTTFYCYSKAGTVKINDLFGPGGSFTAAQAEVVFSGGTLKLNSLPGAGRPPGACSKSHDGTGSDSAGGGGEKTGGSGGGSNSGGEGSEDGSAHDQDGSTGSGGGNTGDSDEGGDDQGPTESKDPIVISCALAPGGETYQKGPDESAQIGQQVRWVNDSKETMSLDITDDPPGWDAAAADDVAPGGAYVFTFTEAGPHGYTCVYPAHKISGELAVAEP